MATIHIGTYAKSGGQGLVPLVIGAGSELEPGQPFAQAANASFGVRADGLVYLVDEQDEGALVVLREESGGWRVAARVSSQGAAPCYLALDRGRTRLALANYGSGSVALYGLDGQGLPSGAPAQFQGEGTGPVADRQDGPHAHCVRFSRGGEGLFWVDLGADRVTCLKLGRGAVFLEAQESWRAPPGSGPRHLLFDPRHSLALVLSELASTLTLLELRDGGMRPMQTLSTLPAGFAGESLGGHLERNGAGTRVYASNRGHNSIAVFALDGGRLELIQHAASDGAHPRHFALLEDLGLLVVAHEQDGRVVLFEVAADGTLAAIGQSAQVPGACFVLAP